MKITEYPSVTELDDDNVFLLDGTNGTKKIAKSDLTYALFDNIPEMHRQIYRGKNLGSNYTIAQKEAVSNGTFHDLWVGDYWEIDGYKYYIADLDYYYDSLNEKHELVIISNKTIGPVKWDDPSLESYSADFRSYAESTLYKNILPQFVSSIPPTFSSNLIANSIQLNNSVNCSSGFAFGENGAAFYELEANFPTFEQIFGYSNPFMLLSRPSQREMVTGAFTQAGCDKFAIFNFIGLEGMGLTKDYLLSSHIGDHAVAVYGRVLPLTPSSSHTRNSFQGYYTTSKRDGDLYVFGYFTVKG